MLNFLRRKNYLAYLTALTLLAIFGSSCNKNFDGYWNVGAPKGGDIYEKLKANPEFTQFAEALDRANVAQFLVTGGSYTVFAPTNAAFSKYLTAKGYASVKDVPLNELFNVVSYHIVTSMWYYYDFKDRYSNPLNKLYTQNKRYFTRLRKYVDVDVSVANSFTVNGVEVVTTLRDIDADNGVIHGIPEVLIPLPSVEDLLMSDPDLVNSTFVKLLKVLKEKTYDRLNSFDRDRDGKIDSVFVANYPLLNGGVNIATEYKASLATVTNTQGTPAYTTLLVPTNAILDAYIAPALAKAQNKIDSLSPSYIEAVLENYVLQDTAMTSTQIKARTGTTLRSSNGDALVATYLKNDAEFVRKDIKASNGYIHLISSAAQVSDRQKSGIWLATIEPDFKLFMAALQKANLMNSYGVSTRAASYLIPSNDAMRAAAIDVVKMTLNGRQLSSTQFSNLVKQQIVNASFNKAGLTGAKTAEAGGTLTFSNNGDLVTNAAGMTATIGPQLYVGSGNNGYVYKSNALLIPSF